MSSIYDFCDTCAAHAATTAWNMIKDDIAQDRLFNDDLRANLYAQYHLHHLKTEKKHTS